MSDDVVVDAGVVTQLDHDNEKVYVSLTKDEIKEAPDFEDRKAARDDARAPGPAPSPACAGEGRGEGHRARPRDGGPPTGWA